MTEPGVETNRYSYSFNDPINLSDPNGNIVDNWSEPGYETAHCSACKSVDLDNDELGPNGPGEHVGRAFVAGLSDRAPLTDEEARIEEAKLQKLTLTTLGTLSVFTGAGAYVQAGRAIATKGAVSLGSQVGAKKAVPQVVKNKIAGNLREQRVQNKLAAKFKNANVQTQSMLRDEFGKQSY